MDETIDRIIKRSGAMWEATRDGTNSPVILCKDIVRGAPVWELWLEDGARHPFWTVRERTLTNEEWHELADSSPHHVGTICPVAHYAETDYVMVNAYVKNGRRPGVWSFTVEPVKVTVERP